MNKQWILHRWTDHQASLCSLFFLKATSNLEKTSVTVVLKYLKGETSCVRYSLCETESLWHCWGCTSYLRWLLEFVFLCFFIFKIRICVLVLSNSAISWILVHQTPLSMEFPRQEYWNGLPCPSPGDLPYPWIEPGRFTPDLNPGLLHCRQILYHLSYLGSPVENLIFHLKCFSN